MGQGSDAYLIFAVDATDNVRVKNLSGVKLNAKSAFVFRFLGLLLGIFGYF